MHRRWLLWAGLLLVGAGVLLIALAWPGVEQLAQSPAAPTVEPSADVVPTRTPEPLIPTRTPAPTLAPMPTPTAMPQPTAIPPTETRTTPLPVAEMPTETLPTAIPATAITGDASRIMYQGRPRWGIGVASGPISRYNVESLDLGWYLDWSARSNPPRPGGIEYVQMVRLAGGVLRPDAQTIATIAQANPRSLWLIGNEPDVKWQDNVEPTAYARLYYEAYAAIKTADPTAQVAIGGVSQPTPLRLRYLEAILASYREQFGVEMPVDVWNVHNFILREEQGSWGVDIPPGLPDERGALYEIEDCGNLEIFRQQIVDFRRWMAQRGYQNYPLIVSEYGIPMPEDYGFPAERVVAFLAGTFDFFSTAADPALGYPTDGYRLVQRWCWYSLDDSDDYYPTGRLFDPQTGRMTAVGEGWRQYVVGNSLQP